METKINSYLGFAIKSRSIVFGQDNLEKYRKKLYLILVCPTANEKMKAFAEYKASECRCKSIVTDKPLSSLVQRDNCKIVGLTNMSLSSAIISCIDNK